MKQRGVWLAVALAAAVAAVLLLRLRRESPAQFVSFAYIPIADAVPLYVALDQRLFERHGIAPAVTEMRGGPQIIEAVAAGHIDVGFANTLSFLLARAAGIRMTPIGAVQFVDREHVRAALLVRPDSTIRTLADLRGKTIAVNASRNIVELALRKVLRNAGVEPSEVRFVEIPFPQMEAALRAGRVDAVPLAEPFWTMAGGRGDLHVVSYYLGEAWPELEIAGWFTLETWRESRPDVAAAVDAALRDAVTWMQDPDNNAEARQIIAKYTGTDSVTATLMAFPAFRPQFTPEHLRSVVEDMRAHGFLDAPLEIDRSWLGGPR